MIKTSSINLVGEKLYLYMHTAESTSVNGSK